MPDTARHARRIAWGLLFVGFVASFASCRTARDDVLTQIRNRGTLRWGGDRAGGAPYITGAPGQENGFEMELAQLLATDQDVKSEFVQGDWDALPDTLTRGDIDIVMNGYEYLPTRESEYPSTIPYFVYHLRLIVRDQDSSIKSWDDLRARDGRPGKRVGVLRGTVAERLMRQKFGDAITLIPTREVDETFQLLQGGERLDATVQDSPAATYFVEQGRLRDLKVVGEPIARGYYVLLTRRGDDRLRAKLNDSIRKGLASGKLKEIYTRYGLWNNDQETLADLHKQPWPPAESEGDFHESRLTLADLWGKILQAAGMTIALSFCAMPLAIVIGILVAIGRLYGPWLIRVPLLIYIEVLRGTPLLLQLFVLFFLMPQFAHWTGWTWLITLATLPPFVVGVAGLAINYSAYEAENYRAGLLAIPKGQTEAALALGMTPGTALRRVILPQAIRIVIPPVTNDFIALFKDTSVCSVILITELTGLYYQFKYDRGVALQLAAVVALLYMGMSYPLSLIARRLEARMARTPG